MPNCSHGNIVDTTWNCISTIVLFTSTVFRCCSFVKSTLYDTVSLNRESVGGGLELVGAVQKYMCCRHILGMSPGMSNYEVGAVLHKLSQGSGSGREIVRRGHRRKKTHSARLLNS